MSNDLEHLFAWTGFYSEEAILKTMCVPVPGGRPWKGEGSLLSIWPRQGHQAEVGGLTCEWHPWDCVLTHTCVHWPCNNRDHGSMSEPCVGLTVFWEALWSKQHYMRRCLTACNQFSSVQSLSRVWLFATPWMAAHQASLSITNSRSLPKLMSIESVMPSSHLILCHPLLLPPSIFPSLRVFSSESVYQRTNTSSPPAIEQTGWLLCCSVFSLFFILYWSIVDLLPSWPSGKEFTCNAWDLGSIPGLTRSPEEEMATLSSILAWEIQWTEEPGGL